MCLVAYQTVFSVACNSDYEILAAFQTVESAVHTQKHCFDAYKVPMFSGGWTWKGFCTDLDSCWLEKGVVTMI